MVCKEQGEYYKHNDNLQYMTVTEKLTIHFGIKMLEKRMNWVKIEMVVYEEIIRVIT